MWDLQIPVGSLEPHHPPPSKWLHSSGTPLTIWISLLSCLTLIFQGFAQGPLLYSIVLHDQNCSPSEETPWACPSSFSLEDAHPTSPKTSTPSPGWLGNTNSKATIQRFPRQGPNPRQTACHRFSLQFLIVLGGALPSNQTDNNAKKIAVGCVERLNSLVLFSLGNGRLSKDGINIFNVVKRN